MQKMLRPVRFLKCSAIVLLILGILVIGAIQVQNHILRYRAERLLEDIRAINLRRTTYRDVETLSTRWNGFARSEMPCSKQHCDVRISFFEPNISFFSPKLFRAALNVYRALGGQGAGVQATVSVRNGFVWGESYQVAVAPPLIDIEDEDGRKGEYTLVAGISTDWPNRLLGIAWPSARKHPEYTVGWTDACSGCVEIHALISPFTDSEDIRRLSQFNLSCLTMFGFCRTRNDIMPAAMAEASRERELWNRAEQSSCDIETTRILSREMEHAGVFDVVANRAVPQYSSDTHRILEVRLVERLKGASFWELGGVGNLDVRDPLALPPIDGLTNVLPGDRVVILFWRQTNPRLAVGMGIEACGVVPYRDYNLVAVRAGIAEDDRVPPLIEYDPQFRPGKFSDLPLLPWSFRWIDGNR